MFCRGSNDLKSQPAEKERELKDNNFVTSSMNEQLAEKDSKLQKIDDEVIQPTRALHKVLYNCKGLVFAPELSDYLSRASMEREKLQKDQLAEKDSKLKKIEDDRFAESLFDNDSDLVNETSKN